MMKLTTCLFGGALLGAGLTIHANADLAFDGMLVQAYSTSGLDQGHIAHSYGPTSIDVFNITALSDGQVDFDTLSYRVFDSWVETMLFVFENDGSPLGSENLIAYNDNSFLDHNGSVSPFDAFLSLFLTAGDYTVAVATVPTVVDDIASGVTPRGIIWDNGGNGIPTEAQYQLDIFGDVIIPAPGSLALLGLGGVMATRRRR